MNRILSVAALTSLLLVTSCAHRDNIPALAGKLGLNSLVDKVVQVGLDKVLSAPGPFTVFGPTDAAFNNIPPEIASKLANESFLGYVLLYHVTKGKVKSMDLADELVVATANGQPARVNKYPKGQDNFNVATVQCAPIDLTQVDQMASNGVIHVINSVMIPPYGCILTFLKVKGFNTLLTALTLTGLDSALSGPKPLTLFAPTDAAFDALPDGVLDALLNDLKALKGLLLYHVVDKTFCSSGLTSGSVETLNGTDVQVTVGPDGVMVNAATVTHADGSVTNGVVHTVDAVILP